jgi:hypothetical protein
MDLGFNERIEGLVSAGIDRSILRVMEWVWRSSGEAAPPARPAGLLEIYRNRTGFFPAPPTPGVEVRDQGWERGARIEHLRWESGYRTWDAGFQDQYDAFEANRIARAECLWQAEPGRPTTIGIHSWMAGGRHAQSRIFPREALYDALGFNLVRFTLPFHGARTPVQARFGGQLFPGRSPQRTNEGFGQMVWDLRGLVSYLLERGSGPVGVIGMSLGGYGAALLASVEPRLAFSVPIIPFVELAELMWSHGGKGIPPERLRAETGGESLEDLQALYAVHCPLEYSPVIAIERRMIIAGKGDRICFPDHVRRLWEHWGRPSIHWWAGSHVAQFGRSQAYQELGAFLQKACAPA